jgi:hypothetical protein
VQIKIHQSPLLKFQENNSRRFLCSTAFLKRGYNSVVLRETPEGVYIWKAEKRMSVLGEKKRLAVKI